MVIGQLPYYYSYDHFCLYSFLWEGAGEPRLFSRGLNFTRDRFRPEVKRTSDPSSEGRIPLVCYTQTTD